MRLPAKATPSPQMVNDGKQNQSRGLILARVISNVIRSRRLEALPINFLSVRGDLQHGTIFNFVMHGHLSIL